MTSHRIKTSQPDTMFHTKRLSRSFLLTLAGRGTAPVLAVIACAALAAPLFAQNANPCVVCPCRVEPERSETGQLLTHQTDCVSEGDCTCAYDMARSGKIKGVTAGCLSMLCDW